MSGKPRPGSGRSNYRSLYRNDFVCYSNRNCDRAAHMTKQGLTEPWYIRGNIVDQTVDGQCQAMEYEQFPWQGVCSYLEIHNPGIYTFATPCECGASAWRRRPQRAPVRVEGQSAAEGHWIHAASAAAAPRPRRRAGIFLRRRRPRRPPRPRHLPLTVAPLLASRRSRSSWEAGQRRWPASGWTTRLTAWARRRREAASTFD